MNKLAKTAIISFLSISSFGLSVAPQANALTSKAINFEPTPTYPSSSPLNLSEIPQEQQVAYIYCETRTDGYTAVSCCVDSYGNWACRAVY